MGKSIDSMDVLSFFLHLKDPHDNHDNHDNHKIIMISPLFLAAQSHQKSHQKLHQTHIRAPSDEQWPRPQWQGKTGAAVGGSR